MDTKDTDKDKFGGLSVHNFSDSEFQKLLGKFTKTPETPYNPRHRKARDRGPIYFVLLFVTVGVIVTYLYSVTGVI